MTDSIFLDAERAHALWLIDQYFSHDLKPAHVAKALEAEYWLQNGSLPDAVPRLLAAECDATGESPADLATSILLRYDQSVAKEAKRQTAQIAVRSAADSAEIRTALAAHTGIELPD